MYVEKLHNILSAPHMPHKNAPSFVEWQFHCSANGFENCIIITSNGVIVYNTTKREQKLDFDVFRRRKKKRYAKHEHDSSVKKNKWLHSTVQLYCFSSENVIKICLNNINCIDIMKVYNIFPNKRLTLCHYVH